MSELQRLEACEVCGTIATEQMITADSGLRYYCLAHLPENVRPYTGGAGVSEKPQYKWYVSGVDGHHENWCSSFWYTSDSAPVEADEYERMKHRVEAAEAKLAAVPVEAIRRCWADGYESENDWAADSDVVQKWLDAQAVQP